MYSFILILLINQFIYSFISILDTKVDDNNRYSTKIIYFFSKTKTNSVIEFDFSLFFLFCETLYSKIVSIIQRLVQNGVVTHNL